MAGSSTADAPAFFFDLASPAAYVAAERALHDHPGVEWIPVLARELPGAESWEAFRCAEERDIALALIERTAAEQGLQPVRWPDPFPFDSLFAMRVATYAKQIGRTVAFALAAYRQAFAGGRSLAEPDNVVIAAAACEMHPAAVIKAARAAQRGRQARGGDGPRDRPRRARRAGRVGRRTSGRGLMRAKGRYRLVVRREGRAPAVLAAPERVDHVEIIDVDEGETVLYWDLLPRDAKRVIAMIRADLEAMDAREFFERWASFEGDADLRH